MVDRADPLSRRGPSRPPGPILATPAQKLMAISLIVLALLELAWFGWVLATPLPNYREHRINRLFLLSRAFPQVVSGTTFRESFLGKGLDEISHVENLPQRVPVILAAVLIAAAATGIGEAVLAGLGMRRVGRLPVRIALAYGVGASILGALTLIAGRLGWLDPWFIRVSLAGMAGLNLLRLVPGRPGAQASDRGPPGADPEPLRWAFLVVMAPFVAITLLGSMLPATDFDVLEYHLQGPKEYFQAGRISFLPHNVYTNMPFNVEMLHLLGMEVMGDWWWGALAGQLLVALFGLATAAMIHATAARISPRAGWIAALVYVSTPWIYRIGVIAYVEGPLCFYHAALAWAWLGRPGTVDRAGWRAWLLLGLLAGGAMGCKYPGLVSAVLPFGLLAVVDGVRGRGVRPPVAFAVGWAVVMAPWLIKNAADTGDPVYPLGYRVFHGRPWDDAMEAKWRNAHGPHPATWPLLRASIVDVAGRSDWQSPLYAALAPLALLRPGSRRTALALWAFAAYLFATWWLLTHRLDRFWLPMLPALAVLAGLGAEWCRQWAWQFILGLMLAVTVVTSLAYDSSALAGFNEWTGDLNVLRRDLPRRLNPPLAALDARLPADARVLLVGQAAVFHLAHPIAYNTVFNPETLEELAKGRDPEAFRRALRDRGLTHVYVDWKEIKRHRQPGAYGFTDFVTPERFAGWVASGVLERPLAWGEEQELYRVRPDGPGGH